VELRARLLAWTLPGFDEEICLWTEVRGCELAAVAVPAAGVRFDSDRGAFVFWSFRPKAVLRAVEAVAPEGVVRWDRPRRIGLGRP
jgi:hypothetical protein